MELARQRAAVFGLKDRIRFFPGNAEQLFTFVPVEPYDLRSWCITEGRGRWRGFC
jgi:hypothetical protein